MNYSLETIPNFDRELKKLAIKYASLNVEIAALCQSFVENPEQRTPIGQSFYKMRLAVKRKGRGKSDISRMLTCVVVVVEEQLILLSIYDKSRTSDISDAFLQQLLNEAGLH